MSRLRGVTAGLRRGARRVNVAGVARVALVAGAGVALVHLATDRPVEIDLVAATGQQQAPLVGTSLATRVALACPGPIAPSTHATSRPNVRLPIPCLPCAPPL